MTTAIKGGWLFCRNVVKRRGNCVCGWGGGGFDTGFHRGALDGYLALDLLACCADELNFCDSLLLARRKRVCHLPLPAYHYGS